MKLSNAHIGNSNASVYWILSFAVFSLLSGCNHMEGLIENMPPQSIILVTGSYLLSGNVLDAATRLPIEGAEISTGKSAFQTSLSDSLGKFTLKLRGYSQQKKVRQLFVAKRGYETDMLVFSGNEVGVVYLRRSVD